MIYREYEVQTKTIYYVPDLLIRRDTLEEAQAEIDILLATIEVKSSPES